MIFFVGLHQPADAKHFKTSLISVNRLKNRKSAITIGNWIMDSGAFTEVLNYGDFRYSIEEYAATIKKFSSCGNLLAAVSQDYVCAPPVLAKTGLSVEAHQILSIARYDALLEQNTGVYIMPVLQGTTPEEYIQHIHLYEDRLAFGSWVGVGSIVRISNDVAAVAKILRAIKSVRPDLKLHGFGVKIVALSDQSIRNAFYSTDSIAWSAGARNLGRNPNDWKEAKLYEERVNKILQKKELTLF